MRDESSTAAETAIRIALLFILVGWCFLIVRAFLLPIIWGTIIAIGVYPGFRRLSTRLGNRPGLASGVITVVTLALLILPTLKLTGMLVTNARDLAGALIEGTLAIPPPPEGVASWPVVGEPVARIWGLAATNLQAAMVEVEPQLKVLATWLLGAAASAGFATLKFLFAIVIAGVLLTRAAAGHAVAAGVARALAGDLGARFLDIAEGTVRSVTRGVLGTAVIQAGLAGVGLVGAGVPGAGLLTLLCLVLCVMQVGPALVLIPAIVWAFSAASTLVATIFLVWSLLVMISDNVLRPWLLSGMTEVPLLVVLVGVLGGMLAHGIIGLFVGPVVLAVAYELMRAWLDQQTPAQPRDASGPPTS